ncbi:MAG: aminotransferase class I/II-fold pyridoxal phosphate-dependent enzyme, partial [Candidatus Cloacimonadaceae bacterium]|nr:aminotransferase class I/II-fold pyridoxal phosphate-dependent enzyme [Candidatus Cloacimonadaceae bacterium]
YISLAREANCKLAILCNPNNPTGNLFDMNDLRHIIRSIPDKPILVDETYFEYSKVSLVKELGEFPNLIIIRSFSKAFAAAGLRFGYVVSSAENILQLRKVQTTFHTSLLVQAFALAILRNRESFLKIVSQTIAIRDELYHWLIGVEGISVKNSSTNFLTFSLGEQSSELFNHLITQGIALRDVGAHPVLKDHLRVTISCKEDVEAFKIALVKFLG